MNEFAYMDRKPALHELISPATLEALSGSRAFQLGARYMDDGAVSDLSATADKIRARSLASGAFRPPGQAGERDYSLRVSVALREKDLEAAWDYANRGTCREKLLLALASELEPSHLDDALALYRRVVPGIIEQTGNEAYADAIKIVQRMGGGAGHAATSPGPGRLPGIFAGRVQAQTQFHQAA